jgi:hypothetical protein
VIDEELAKNSPRSPGSNVSLEKEEDGWNSEYDSDKDASHAVTREDVRHALKVLSKGNLL